jgi:hypothetical protein
MDEQRKAQQGTRNSTHYSVNRDRHVRAAKFIPAIGIYLIQTFDKPGGALH